MLTMNNDSKYIFFLIFKNITYIQNEGYPNTYQGGAGNWTFRLEGNAGNYFTIFTLYTDLFKPQ